MTTKTRQTRSRNNADQKSKGEIVSFDVFLSEDPFEAGKESKKEPLGPITFSQNYLKDAAQQFGGGEYYYFLPRHADGSFGTGKTLFCPRVDQEAIEEPFIEDDIEAETMTRPDIRRIIREEMSSSVRNPQNGHASNIIELVTAMKELKAMTAEDEPRDKTSEIIGTLKGFEEIRRMFSPREENPRPIIESKPMTTEAALLKLISEDPIALAAARERLLGSEGESFSFMQLLPAIMPTVERIVSSITDAMKAANPSPAIISQPGGDQSSPERAFIQPQSPQTQTTGDMSMQAYGRVFNSFLTALATNADVEPIVTSFDSFCNLFPEHALMIEGLMTQPPEMVIGFLNQALPQAANVLNAPHAVDWIKRLQEAYLKEPDDQPGDEPIKAAKEAVS